MADLKFDKDNWYIETTDENREVLKKYFKESGVTKDWVYRSGYTYGVRNGEFASGLSNQNEITFNQFKEHILKEKQVIKFELPEKWYIITTAENKEVLNDWRKTKCSYQYEDSKLNIGYPVISKHLSDDSYFVMSSAKSFFPANKQYNDYVEITFDQFKEHILKEKNMEKEIFKFDKNNWCFKNGEEHHSEFINLYNNMLGQDYLGYYGYYGFLDGKKNSSFDSWGTELTLDQFKEYILNNKPFDNTEPEQTKEFVFDKNNWCYKNNREEGSNFIKLYCSFLNHKYTGNCVYYGLSGGQKETGITPWGTELTFEQFVEHILNKKKIIGYKTPFDLYTGTPGAELKAGSIATKQNEVFYKVVLPISDKEEFIFKEIVEKWEPVYELQFKIGDIIWAKNDSRNGLEDSGDYYEVVDNSFKSRATGRMENSEWDFIVKSTREKNSYFRILSTAASARLATADEIRKNKEYLVKVGSHEVRVTTNGIFAENTKINVEDLKGSINLLTPRLGKWDVSLTDATFKYGCWENCKLSEILDVLSKWSELQ